MVIPFKKNNNEVWSFARCITLLVRNVECFYCFNFIFPYLYDYTHLKYMRKTRHHRRKGKTNKDKLQILIKNGISESRMESSSQLVFTPENKKS